jgi:cytochrome c biogenesis protein CcmG/thiol:disulfide interchange protein DsbE
VSTPSIRRRAWLTAAGVGVLLVVALLVNRATAKHTASSPLRASLVAAADLPDCPTTTARSGVKNGLPALTLPCLAQGPKVTLSKLRGPALVNIWAGPCEDCKIEAPQLRAFAVAAHGRVAVLGVVDGAYNGSETWDDALDAAHGLKLGYPSVWDGKGALVQWTRAIGIPVTLFVRADGTVAYRKVGRVAVGELEKLTSQYLGIDVPTT